VIQPANRTGRFFITLIPEIAIEHFRFVLLGQGVVKISAQSSVAGFCFFSSFFQLGSRRQQETDGTREVKSKLGPQNEQ